MYAPMKKYKPRRIADINQSAALKVMRGRPAFALLMAMRTRKTKVVLDDYGEMELAGKVNDLLVIAPAGALRPWLQAIVDDLSDDLQNRAWIHDWRSNYTGVAAKAVRKAFLADQRSPRLLLMNVEALSRKGPAREFLGAFLSQPTRTMAVIDESTCIKNRSKRTEFVIRHVAPRAHYRRIMSGLVTPRSPLDLYFQFEFLNPDILGFNTWRGFRAHVAHMKIEFWGGHRVEVIDKEQGNNGFRPEAIVELRSQIAPHSHRVEFRPKTPSTYSVREVELTDKQKKAYSEIRDDATTQLSATVHVTATVVIAQIIRMHQVICGHVRDEQNKIHLLPENKTAAVLELLEDHQGKAIIWFAYVNDLERTASAIAEEYGRAALALFYGGNEKTREADDKRFRTDSACRFMLATAGSGGKGRAWHAASLVIYHSSTDDLEKRDQSEQRAHDRDKQDGVDYVDLIAPGTVEEKILHALRKKINMAQTINGDKWREWIV